MTVLLDNRLTWQDVAKVGQGETLALTNAAIQRIENAARIVESIVERGIRAYGINTGVGALS
ncbi:aromatic amino acid lyase, partial [Agrobacterium cavarae]